MRNIYNAALILIFLLFPVKAFCAAGVLIPRSIKSTPDSSILSIEKLDVYIDINNQYADVKIIHIYKNHRNATIEGEYVFTMPDGAKISDFAIWEDNVRIEGVIMEKMKAREIYERITRYKKDPGLLETTDVKSVINKFSCKVFPIPPYGSKRIEINYKQDLSINDLKTYFLLPLKPDLYGEQSVKDFYLSLKVNSMYPIKNFNVVSEAIRADFEITDNLIRGDVSLSDYALKKDFIFTYDIDVKDTFYYILTHRDLGRIYSDISPANGKNYQDDSGYFLVKSIFNFSDLGVKDETKKGKSKNIVFILDASLSMLFDKLDRAYETLNYFMDKLGESDRFNLLIFNDSVNNLSDDFLAADRVNVQAARDFVDKSYISGGTDIEAPFKKAFSMFDGDGENYVIFISDGYPTIGEIKLGNVKDKIKKMNEKGVKLFPFGIGDDTNKDFLQDVAQENEGFFSYVGSTQDVMINQEIFFNKVGQTLVRDLIFLHDGKNAYDVYPVEKKNVFNKMSIDYVGKYNTAKKESFRFSGSHEDEEFSRELEYDLPEVNKENGHIRRIWAERRVEYLLKKIKYEGETKEMVTEIIALAKQFKFVTPYTSFLAAPRAFLRPRVIKPGDPVLKVKADESIVEVIAIFPFGLTKKMDYIKEKEVFKTRFLVPSDVKDGEYFCRLILKDESGNVYKEKKSFIVDNAPPVIKVSVNDEAAPGETVMIKVFADKDTKELRAKFPYSKLVSLKYDSNEKASVGYLKISEEMQGGSYKLKITATDFAHNTSSKEIELRIKSL